MNSCVLLGIMAVAGWLVALWTSYDSLKTIKKCEELCDSLNESWRARYNEMNDNWKNYCDDLVDFVQEALKGRLPDLPKED